MFWTLLYFSSICCRYLNGYWNINRAFKVCRVVVPKYLSDTFSLQILLKTLISSHFIAMYCHVTFHTIHPSLPSGKLYLCFKLCLNIASSRKSFLYRRFFIPLLYNLICLVCINIYLMYYSKNFEGKWACLVYICSHRAWFRTLCIQQKCSVWLSSCNSSREYR